MKFLDPHEKIVIELKDEIRRLRHENQKLRSNIASAPAATGGEKPLSNDNTFFLEIEWNFNSCI